MSARSEKSAEACKTHSRTVIAHTRHGAVKTVVRIPMTHERRHRFS